MEQLLFDPEGSLQREPSGAFFVPARARSTCSGDVATESSSATFEDTEEQQQNLRRITLCKQVLLEATTKYSAAPLVDITLMKDAACRNSGALGPLLSMLAAEHDANNMVRCLDTLSFLLLDRTNRRACHELGALGVLLDALHRSTDQHVLLSGLETLCCLCKHDPKDKMALWQHKKKGVLLSMLNSCHGSTIVVEALRTCRILCFAAANNTNGYNSSVVRSSWCGAPPCQSVCGHGHCNNAPLLPPQRGSSGNGSAAAAARPAAHLDPSHHQYQYQPPGTLQLLEPSLLTVASGLLHPAADTAVLKKVLKLLIAASGVAVMTAVAGASGGTNHGGLGSAGQGCGGCWRNPVFQMVPLLTHCSDVVVVESALAVLVNLSEHSTFHWLLDASGCIPPLLHLLSHKRCGISRSASCVLSVLAEGGVPRVKLCQDTALLAMLRVLQTNHCNLVTMGVLYMLGRLASFRGSVVRSLKGWGAVPLLNHLLATTRDEDAAHGCRQLLQLLGMKPPPTPSVAVGIGGGGTGGGSGGGLNLPNAYSSIIVFGGTGGGSPSDPITGAAVGSGTLLRTISAAATMAAAEVALYADGKTVAASNMAARSAVPASARGALEGSSGCESGVAAAAATTALLRPRQRSSFRHYFAAPGGGLLAPMSAAAAAAY